MTAPKVIHHFGLLAKSEAAYNTFNAPAAGTDGLAIIEPPEWEIDYADQGEREGRAPATTGGLKRVAKSGRFARLPIVMNPAGYGAAYSAANLPNVDRVLRAAGYAITTDLTVGSEKHTYLTADQTGTPYSLSLEAYDSGERAQIAGSFVEELVWEIVNGRLPKLTAQTVGTMAALPTDVALPAITYGTAQARVGAKANGLGLTLGGIVPTKVRQCTITDTIGAEARLLDNTNGGHGGFVRPASRTVKINFTIEALALATMNPYNIADLATASAFLLQVGSVQYDRLKLQADNLQIDNVQRAAEGAARVWEIEATAKPSSLTAYDSFRVLFD